jgi:hypothetical protein
VSSLAGLFDSTAFPIRRLKPPVNGSTAKPSVFRPWRGFPPYDTLLVTPTGFATIHSVIFGIDCRRVIGAILLFLILYIL